MIQEEKSRETLYREFLEFISNDIQQERQRTNRRMLSVFFWCFLLPAMMSASILFLVKLGFLPRSARSYLDWLVLILPVLYSLYVLSSEVLSHVPSAVRRGGIAASLGQAVKEGEWRQRTIEALLRNVDAGPQDWEWITASFRMDLQAMQYRTKYLTALAGAVFFLIMQGIDSLMETDQKVTWVRSPILGWVETGWDLSQYVGLSLFLVLLYLSGSQSNQSLNRYLCCAELVVLGRARAPAPKRQS